MSLERLRLENIVKYFAAKPILQDISFHLNDGDRAALVGENGAGKTTLAKLILGQLGPDSGAIWLPDGIRLGYLPQDIAPEQHETVAMRMGGRLYTLRSELRDLEAALGSAPPDLDATMTRYGEALDAFEAAGGYEMEHRMAALMDGLGIGDLASDRALSSLSGGQKTRVALAGLLLAEPDLLILDEPTNHLDFAALHWLEDYLAGYPHALLLISHDRAFVNRTATQIIELDSVTQTARVFTGAYDDYLAARQAERAAASEAFFAQRQQVKHLKAAIRAETHSKSHSGKLSTDPDKFIRNIKIATAEKTSSKAIRDAKKELADLHNNPLEHPDRVWHVEYRFAPRPSGARYPLRLGRLRFSYDDSPLLVDVNAVAERGQRIALVAPNGAGKSTLLALIAGVLAPQSGDVQSADSATIGFLPQDDENLAPDATILEAYSEDASDAERIAALHRAGLFGAEVLGGRQVGMLSAGQRRKLNLANLVASRANLLLLDEPTNHLDFPTLEALEAALVAFEGTVIAATHDRHFIETVATHVWALLDGQIIPMTPAAFLRSIAWEGSPKSDDGVR